MNYQQTLDYLYTFLDSEAKLPRRPAEFNLPRTRALLDDLGNPQRQLRCVVIAGTKGKGSTAVMLESITRAAGYHTGVWSSPHLHSYRERIQVDRLPISREALVAAVADVQPALDRFDSAQYGIPSVFEVGFGLALRHFAAQNVDLAILEVGLGGRYDSANVVTPILSMITSISYDHMQVLGNTLAKIAYEKVGIAKTGVPLVTGAQPHEAMAVIAQVCQDVGAPLVVADAAADTLNATPHLPGTFQRDNARIAIAAALALREQGYTLGNQAVTHGLANARWPGRMEIIPGAPIVLIDGAHNGDSARRLHDSIRELLPGRKIVLVFGTTREKDVEAMFVELLPHIDALVLTHSRHPRAETDLAALAQRAAPLLERGSGAAPIIATSDVPEALDRARALAGPDDLICVTGSLFVVAAAREALGIAEEID